MVWSEGHERLDRLAGTWRTERVTRFNGRESTSEGVESYSWADPTRVWLRREVSETAHPVLGRMNGFELWSWDDRASEYVHYWFDNQSPEAFPHKGRWVDEDTLVLTGHVEWRGRDLYLKEEFHFDGPDRFTRTNAMSWDTDDAFVENGSTVYTRLSATGSDPERGAYMAHLASLTDGIWLTSNARYQEEDGGIDRYGMAYTLHPGGLAATGCLWQEQDGTVTGVPWQFFMAWDPIQRAGIIYQSSPNGLVAMGYERPGSADWPELVQEMWTPDGTMLRVGHFEELDGPDRRISRSVGWSDGDWHPRRSYTWVRSRDASHPCTPPAG